MLKALVVDHHTLVCELLIRIVHRLGDDVACHGAGNVEEALSLLEGGHYDLMLIELMMPGINGADILDTLRQRFPALPVVVVSTSDDAAIMSQAIRHGAAGFVPKSCSSDELLEVLRKALAGCVSLPPQLKAGGPIGRSFAKRHGLTRGQMRVLVLLVKGGSNREIASQLGLLVGTVKSHIASIFKALKVTRRQQAIILTQQDKNAHRLLQFHSKSPQRNNADRALQEEIKLGASMPVTVAIRPAALAG